MATLLQGTDLATGTTINIPASDIISVEQKNGSSDSIVVFVSNKSINSQVILENKDIDACSFQGGAIDAIVPVVPSTVETVVTGTATAGAATTITLTGTSTTNDAYKDMYVYVTAGTGLGQVRKITGYVGSTKVATVENSWTVNPDNTSVYIVAETGNLINATKIGLFDVNGKVFLYNDNGSAKKQIYLNADQSASSFVTYINTAIDEAAATYVTLSTTQTVSGAKTFSGGATATTLTATTSATTKLLVSSGTQTLTGAGAVDILNANTLLVTTGANALTLANGAEGQDKMIKMKTDGGDGTLTPTSLQGGTTITFNDAGDFVYLRFLDGKWNILANSGCTVA